MQKKCQDGKGDFMNIWEGKFEELAKYNADNDKTKYTNEYVIKMNDMQNEYNEKLASWAKENGHIVL